MRTLQLHHTPSWSPLATTTALYAAKGLACVSMGLARFAVIENSRQTQKPEGDTGGP